MRNAPPSPARLALLPLAALAFGTAAQEFTPFTATKRQLFGSVPGWERTYSMAFDSAALSGADSVWYPFRTVAAESVPNETCPFWVFGLCWPQDVPTWLGRRIEQDGDGYRFFTHTGQAITFDAGAGVGTTTELFSDAEQRFTATRQPDDTWNVLGIDEPSRRWTIAHTDLDDVPIASPINGAEIRITQTAGLVKFLRVDSFPLVLEPVELVGQAQPPRGVSIVNGEFIFDHQPGDVIQSRITRSQSFGPPDQNYDHYLKKIFLTRSDLALQIVYTVRTERFDVTSGAVEIDTVELAYARNEVFAAIPVERYTGVPNSLGMEDHCGLGLWHYRTEPQAVFSYCEEDNCWGIHDTGGPPVEGHDDLAAGLGVYDRFHMVTSPWAWTESERIIYFEKNGTACGNEVSIGLPAPGAAPVLRIGPNPTDDRVTVNAPAVMAEVRIHDVNGRIVWRGAPRAGSAELRIGELAPGPYVVVALLMDGREARATVVRR